MKTARKAARTDPGESTEERFHRMHQQLREQICLLHYPPGMVLNESDLANEFGVSRTPIRRVVQRLNFEGLVETRNGVGTIVTDVDFQNFKEVYDVRMKLAEMSGELSSVTNFSRAVPKFENLLARTEELYAEQNLTEMARINNSIQSELSAMISNETLRELTELLYYRTARIWLKLTPQMNWEEEVDFIRAELLDYLRALRLGDARGLGLARRNYLFMILVRVSKYLTNNRDI